MNWTFVDDRPIWQQLTAQITAQILTGKYPPGSRLPSVRELAAEAGVNPNTMQRAMAMLEQDGLCENNRTAGRTVTRDNAAIHKIRAREARIAAKAYIQALEALGYSRNQATIFLTEELHHD